MKKVLLALPYHINNHTGFTEILNHFDNQGYDIHVFNDINPGNFRRDILPVIIESLKSEPNETTVKIAVMSNIREAVFSWYRCYNSLVDDYIYYIDDNSDYHSLLQPDPNYPCLMQLAGFNGIEDEYIEGKIYLNIDFKNYSTLFSFLIVQNNFKYFDEIDNFNFETKRIKKTILKDYDYNNKTYRFYWNTSSSDVQTRSYILGNPPAINAVATDAGFMNQITKHRYFIPFIMIEFYKTGNANAGSFLIRCMEALRESATVARHKICSEILNYLEQGEHGFMEKIYLLFLVDMLKVEQGRILEMSMKTLLEDEMYIDYHYPILVNTLYFLSIINSNIYDDYYLERRAELGKIANYFRKEITLHVQRSLNNKHIAIIVDQLLSILHSPTKVMLDYVKTLKQAFPDYSFKLFVEDEFVFLSEEIMMPHAHRSKPSEECYQQHVNYLDNNNIEIFYSDGKLPKKERVTQMVREVANFDPEVILTTDDLSISLELLYPFYPIVYVSLGGISTSIADLYLFGVREPAVKDNEKSRMMNSEDIYELKWGPVLPQALKIFQRSDYNIGRNDFVLVTVGNRLDSEMNAAYIDFMAAFLKKDPNLKWLVVGPAGMLYMRTNYPEIFANQVISIQYETDLAGLYRICDVYVNPPRDGGGFSIAIAMNEGIPVVSFSSSYSCVGYMGIENCAGNTDNDYLRELERLYNDRSYWQMKSNFMKELIRQFDIQNTVKQFMNYFQIAKQKFIQRIQKPRERNIQIEKQILEKTFGTLAEALKKAFQFETAEQWDAALELYYQGLAIAPDHKDILLSLGLCLYKKGAYEDALDFLVKSYDHPLHTSDKKAGILEFILSAYYEPNEPLLRANYEKNRKQLESYQYNYLQELSSFDRLPYLCIAVSSYTKKFILIKDSKELKSIDIPAVPSGDIGSNDCVVLVNYFEVAKLAQILKQTEDPRWNHNIKVPVYLIWTDPILKSIFLQLNDYSSILAAERFVLFDSLDPGSKFAVFLKDHQANIPFKIIASPSDITRLRELITEAINLRKADEASKTLEIKERYPSYTREYYQKLFNDSPEKLRILFITSRFTQVLQYTVKDFMKACIQLGFSCELEIEKSDIHQLTIASFTSKIAEFKPDVIFQADYFKSHRAEIPENIMYVTWMQDPMPHMTSPEHAQKFGENDYILAHTKKWMELMIKAGFPQERIILQTVPIDTTIFHPYELTTNEKEYYASDVAFCANHNAIPEELLKIWVQTFQNSVTNDFLRRQIHSFFMNVFHSLLEIVQRGDLIESIDQCKTIMKNEINLLDLSLNAEQFEKLAEAIYIELSYGTHRKYALEAITDAGIQLKIWGKYWDKDQKLAKYAMGWVQHGEQLAKVYSSSKIVIGATSLYTGHLRVWEALACGAICLVRFVLPEFDLLNIGDYLSEGEGFVFYYNHRDLVDKITYFLKHEAERKEIAAKGLKRVRECLTYDTAVKRWLAFSKNDMKKQAVKVR